MGRPRQKDELKRCKKVTFMMNESEYNRVHSDAEELGITLSTYIRAKTLSGYVKVPKYAKVNHELIGQLSKMGGLLKLTHKETGGIYREKTGDILDKIYFIIEKIQEDIENDREAYSEPERS
jgi:hypothetical protein